MRYIYSLMGVFNMCLGIGVWCNEIQLNTFAAGLYVFGSGLILFGIALRKD